MEMDDVCGVWLLFVCATYAPTPSGLWCRPKSCSPLVGHSLRGVVIVEEEHPRVHETCVSTVHSLDGCKVVYVCVVKRSSSIVQM